MCVLILYVIIYCYIIDILLRHAGLTVTYYFEDFEDKGIGSRSRIYAGNNYRKFGIITSKIKILSNDHN